MRLVADLSLCAAPHRRGAGLPPALDLDFTSGALSPLVSHSRAGPALYRDAAGLRQSAAANVPRFDHEPVTLVRRGLLLEGPRSNLILGSLAPVSQAVSVTAQIYTLSFEGAGSITLSGAHSAVLGGAARNVLIFTPAAGTLSLTMAGDVGYAQLEAGNCPTSFIATTSAAVSRAGDEAILPLGSWWNAAEGTFLAEWQDIHQQSGNTRIAALVSAQALLTFATPGEGHTANQLYSWNGSSGLTVTAPSDVTKGIRRGVVAWSASGRSLAVAGQVSRDSNPVYTGTAPGQIWLGSQSAALRSINGCLRRIRFWNRRLSDDELAALTL